MCNIKYASLFRVFKEISKTEKHAVGYSQLAHWEAHIRWTSSRALVHCTGCASVEAGFPLRKPTATISNPWAPCASENVVKPPPSLPQPRSCEFFAMETSTKKFLESLSLWSACSPSQSQQPGEPESVTWEWEWRILTQRKRFALARSTILCRRPSLWLDEWWWHYTLCPACFDQQRSDT